MTGLIWAASVGHYLVGLVITRRDEDLHLAEGTGIARRYTVGDGRVEELAPLTYEAVRQDPTMINLRDL